MDPLSTTGSIIAIIQLSTKVLAYLNDVKGASKERAQCTIEISNLQSLLFTLRFRLEEEGSEKPWHTAVQALALKNGPLDQFKQALELLQTKMTEGSRLKKAAESLVWKFVKSEIASILDRIERLKILVQIALQMDHFKLSQAIKDGMESIQKQIPTIQSGLDTIRRDHSDARHDKLIAWISPTNFPALQSDLIARRQEGTGQWFLHAPEVTKWLNEPKKTLFCAGIPGAGKTMIAATVINHLLKSVQSSTVGVAYVYCDYKAQVAQDAASLLAALLKQLVQAQPSTAEPVEQLYEQYASQDRKPTAEEIFRALQSVLAKFPTVFIVVDALDEYRDVDGTRRLVLAQLRSLQTRIDLRLMFTSRFIPDIVDEFREALTLEVHASDGDVRHFVAGQIHRLARCIQCDTSLQDMVQDKIAEAVDGMFLLARLHTDSLMDKRTKKDVVRTLNQLRKGSTTLNSAYEGAIQRVEGQLSGDCALAKRVLSWIMYAQRPLTTAEIRCALAVELEKGELDLDNVPYIEDIVLVCAGLVIVDERSKIIRLVHYTTQEYFERIRKEWNPSAELEITSICLTYLCFDTFKGGACPTDYDFESRLEQNVFLDYAARYWGQHGVTVQDEVYELACRLLLHNNSISSAIQALSVSDFKHQGYSQNYPKRTTGLHVTARFGLPIVSKEFFSRLGKEAEVSVNAMDSFGQAPLLFAARAGHEGMVKLLIDTGADIDALAVQYGNALRGASEEGYEKIVMMLLNAGADIEALGGEYGSALYAASASGHEQIVKLLLIAGADVNAFGGYYGSPLRAASEGGHEQVIRLLLDAGADMNAPDEYHGSALQGASEGGYEQVVKILLDAGADIEAQGGEYSSALQAASYGGHDQMVKLLLDAGANVNDLGGEDVLYIASWRGHEQVVKLLLGAGADVKAHGGKYGSALQAASHEGHEQVVKQLMDAGADNNTLDQFHGSALLAASEGATSN